MRSTEYKGGYQKKEKRKKKFYKKFYLSLYNVQTMGDRKSHLQQKFQYLLSEITSTE